MMYILEGNYNTIKHKMQDINSSGGRGIKRGNHTLAGYAERTRWASSLGQEQRSNHFTHLDAKGYARLGAAGVCFEERVVWCCAPNRHRG